MNISLKLVLAACLLSSALLSESDAGKRGGFKGNSAGRKISSSKSFSNNIRSRSFNKSAGPSINRNRMRSNSNSNFINKNRSNFKPVQKNVTSHQPQSNVIKGLQSNQNVTKSVVRPGNKSGDLKNAMTARGRDKEILKHLGKDRVKDLGRRELRRHGINTHKLKTTWDRHQAANQNHNHDHGHHHHHGHNHNHHHHGHVHHWWLRPVCLPPIRRCPPVYSPCVTAVCPNVVVDRSVYVDPVVAQETIAQAEIPVLQLAVGKPATLEAEGLGNEPGTVAIEVGGVGLPAEVTSWSDTRLAINVPFVGLDRPTPARLHLFDSNGQPLASIPVELVVPVETAPAATAG